MKLRFGVIALTLLAIPACRTSDQEYEANLKRGIAACCELPNGDCISVSRGADGSAVCAERGGTHKPDQTCYRGRCVDPPAERVGCCQLSGNCVTTTRAGCLSGVWYEEFVCIEGRCVRPQS